MFRITLEEFEGPLDLLLFFIKRDELDIYNIPLSRITGEFITYITAMHSLDLEVAAEFIYMASLLMSIKARMLLPRQTADSDDGSEFDPRTELVQRLLEYKRIKEGAAELRIIAAERENMFPLGFTEPPEPETIDEMDQPLNRPTLYHLITAYQSVLDQMPKTRTQNISDAPVTVEQQSQLIFSRLREKSAGFISFPSRRGR